MAVAEVAVAGMAVAEGPVAGMVGVAEVAARAVEVAAAGVVVVVVVEEAVRQAHLWAEAEVVVVPGVLPVAGDRLIVWLPAAFWRVVMFSFWQSALRCCCRDVPD